MKKLLISLILFLLLTGLALHTSHTQAAVVLDNLTGESQDPSGTDLTDSGNEQKAVAFTTVSGNYVIDSLDVFGFEENGSTVTLQARLHAHDGSSVPGTQLAEIASINVAANAPDGVYTFTPGTTITLQNGVSYWIVLEITSGAGQFEWSSPVSAATPGGTFTFIEYSFFNGFSWVGGSTVHNMLRLNASPPTSAAPINVPNVGTVLIRTTNPQPVYEAPGGGLVRVGVDELWLPNDADGSGYDTYTVTSIEQLDNGEVWVEIFLGSAKFVWVPLDNVIPVTYLDIPTE